MKQLSRALSRMFSPTKRRVVDPGYGRFRSLVKTHGIKYRVTRDQFLEVEPCPALPRGLKTSHLDWEESSGRIEHCIATPAAVDQDGYYSE